MKYANSIISIEEKKKALQQQFRRLDKEWLKGNIELTRKFIEWENAKRSTDRDALHEHMMSYRYKLFDRLNE